ncbi:MAG: hypothetical protein CSB33_05690 [Desulfobacterales bacterium]|nr:MAG: hypothetical protein CSB33_05690 [Desulfobacterales bacterium]
MAVADLPGGEGMFVEAFNLLRAVGEQQVQYHGETHLDLTVHVGRRLLKQVRHPAQIHIFTRQRQGESNVILSTAPSPACHLVQLGGVEGDKFGSVEAIRIEHDDGSGRKIDRGGKHHLQEALCHQLLQSELPGRQLPAVMGPDGTMVTEQLRLPGQLFDLLGQLRFTRQR